MRVIDLSHPLTPETPPYPGEAAASLTHSRTLESHGYNAYTLTTGMHVGTHIDAPLHMLPDERFLDAFPAERFVGRGVLIDARGREVIEYDVGRDPPLAEGDIVLVYTGWDAHWGTLSYFRGHPVFGERFADYLVKRRIKLVGMDIPTPDFTPFHIHKALLGADILLAENLTNLNALMDVETFTVCAAPPRIAAEGAPVRVLAMVWA